MNVVVFAPVATAGLAGLIGWALARKGWRKAGRSWVLCVFLVAVALGATGWLVGGDTGIGFALLAGFVALPGAVGAALGNILAIWQETKS